MSKQPQGIINYPINTDNEALIISNAIQSETNRQIFTRLVSYEKFREKQFQTLAWGVLEAVRNDLDINIDAILLKAKSCPIKQMVDFSFIEKLITNFPIVSEKNFKQHLEVLVADSTKESLLRWAVDSILPACTKTDTTVADLDIKVNYGKSIIERGYSAARLEFKSMAEVMQEYELAKVSGATRRTSGFSQLDQYLTEGFLEGKITTIAGLSSQGKSSLALTIMKNLSQLQVPVPTAQFALEMNNMSIFTKFLAFRTQLPINTVIKKPEDLTPEELKIYDHEKKQLAENKHIFLADNPSRSIAGMREQILLLQDKLKQQYIVVIVDLFGKLKDFQSSDNFARDYEKKLNQIQILVRELGIHMILVTQINRAVSQRKDKRPTMNDLKNAHALTEVSDIMLGINRPYYDPTLAVEQQLRSDFDDGFDDSSYQMVEDDLNKNLAEIILMKQRMGPKDILLNFIFDPETTCFYPITEEYQHRLNELKLEGQ